MFTAKLTVNTALLERCKAAVGPGTILGAIGTYLVLDGMPGYFQSSGEGTWAPVRRGGKPLMLTLDYATGFTWAVDSNKVRLTNTGKPSYVIGVLSRGATIKPKVDSHTVTRGRKTITVKNYLHFKYKGGWAMVRQVVIPPRPWDRWTPTLLQGASDFAMKTIRRIIQGGA
jgi:hypothetical protein